MLPKDMQLAAAIDTVTSGLTDAGSTAGFTESNTLAIVSSAIDIILGLLGMVAFGFIVYAGVLYLLSRGEEKKVTDAKQVLTYAIIGMVIIVASYAIASYLLGALEKVL